MFTLWSAPFFVNLISWFSNNPHDSEPLPIGSVTVIAARIQKVSVLVKVTELLSGVTCVIRNFTSAFKSAKVPGTVGQMKLPLLFVPAVSTFQVGVPAEALFVYSSFIWVEELIPVTFVQSISLLVEPTGIKGPLKTVRFETDAPRLN